MVTSQLKIFVSSTIFDLPNERKAAFEALRNVGAIPIMSEYTMEAVSADSVTACLNKVRESDPGVGFDAYAEEYVDMVSKGILDPAKVTRSALQNATSVASTLLTTESVVATIKEDVPAMPAGGAGGMGMM